MTDHKISAAQFNFLLRHAGNELTPDQARRYVGGHHAAVAAGHEVDSPKYFRAVGKHVESTPAAERPARREQPAPPKPRYDGASVPMPKLRSRDPDPFHTLRDKATNNGRYGKK